MKENLGKLEWIADLNPIYLVISQLRDSLIGVDIIYLDFIYTFLFNIFGLVISLFYFRKLKNLIPFLV